jgi:hypothetical protein
VNETHPIEEYKEYSLGSQSKTMKDYTTSRVEEEEEIEET